MGSALASWVTISKHVAPLGMDPPTHYPSIHPLIQQWHNGLVGSPTRAWQDLYQKYMSLERCVFVGAEEWVDRLVGGWVDMWVGR